MKKRVLTIVLAVLLLLGNNAMSMAFAAVSDEVSATANYIAGMYDESDPATYENDLETLYIARSGIADKSLCNQYLSSLENELRTNGKLTYSGGESVVYYATAAINLAVLGEDATDFGGCNIIEKIEKFDRDKVKSTSIYSLPMILYAVEGYKNEITDSTLKTDIINAIVSQYSESADGKGFDNWGYSTDTNAKVISALLPYYGTDSELDKVIDNTSEWLMTQLCDEGFNYNTTSSWNAVNADSTGLGLAFLAAKGDRENADKAYSALLSMKGVSAGAFAYTAGGDDNYFATKDAMEGLLAYQRLVNGQKSIYDITDTAVYKYRDVIAKIDAVNDKESAVAARAAYNALPEAFKKKVTNLSKLEQIEEELFGSSSSEIIESDPSSEVSSNVTSSDDAISSEISSDASSSVSSSKPANTNNGKGNAATEDTSPIRNMVIILAVSGSIILLMLVTGKKGAVKH